jgi:hypothetical protein
MAGEVIHEHLNHTERFAAYLRMLKSRSGFGFNQLGKLAGVSSSSLHRYCSGASVPQDYRIVLSFARSCGATTEEIRHLHRLWAAAEAVRHTEPVELVADVEAVEPFAADDTDLPEPEPQVLAPPPRRRGRHLAIAAAGVVVLLAAAGLFALRASDDPTGPGVTDDRLLFSRACQDPVSMGQHDECVREVQDLLIKAGGRLAVDGEFGPETLRRVTAFQVLAGLPPRGVVDDVTKTALYDQRARINTWPPERVETRIREVFPEDPDHAVAIARCQSRLDPLHITPNTNGSRNWGLYQLSDASLASLGGTPAQAFDPEWNITAAHRLWNTSRDFHHWPFCEAALNATPSPTTSVR